MKICYGNCFLLVGWKEVRFLGVVFVYYKDRSIKFWVRFRVRFENEEGVGSGFLREFFFNVMKIVGEGLGFLCGKMKLVIFFEVFYGVFLVVKVRLMWIV